MARLKEWRTSELVMTLVTYKEKAQQYRKAIQILKDAQLEKAAETMRICLESMGKHIRMLNREIDRREAGPKNIADAFKL